tara:strand:+ start:24588 stop:26348 length:1761 start_codon:yes stop_codon:yes gene_type:complete
MPTFGKSLTNLKDLWSFVSIHRKKQFVLLIILSFFSAMAEIITIGLVIPFLAVLTNPNVILEFEFIVRLFDFFNFQLESISVFNMSLFFASAAFISGTIRVLMIYSTVKYSFSTGSDLAHDMYKKILNQEYSIHLNRNSSQLVDIIFQKINLVIQNVLVTSITLISNTIIVFIIFMFLLLVKPKIVIGTLLILGIAYALLIRLTRNRVFINSKSIAKNSNNVIKNIQEGVTGIKEILLSNTQSFFSNKFKRVESSLRNAQADNSFIAFSPRYIMETIGIVVIVILAYFINDMGNLGSEITLLGMLALTAQRLLPLVNQAYYSYTSIRGEQVSLEDVLNLLSQSEMKKSLNESKINFDKNINISDIYFSYNSSKLILDSINLEIPKGSKVGLVGETASGKSTLADVLAFLLMPNKGKILVDGNPLDESNYKSWQRKISYVSQSIFLNDNTIKENIAFGEKPNQIDMDKVVKASSMSQLQKSIDSLPDGYNTIIGEKGLKLSGGQRQRLAIARALYRNSSLLILDEATSALDTSTETAVMESIMSLDKSITMFIIAHRITTLRECDIIIELRNGKITFKGTYENFIKR